MKINFACLLSMLLTCAYAQLAWDDAQAHPKPTWLEKIEITASYDGTPQPAMVYRAIGSSPRPLLISLHTWSGDYLQTDSLATLAMERNWNYIHPNFRGANNHPMACGSAAAVQDVADAIQWGLQYLAADSNKRCRSRYSKPARNIAT